MTPEEGRAWLELAAEYAPRLRDQGVTHAELGPLKLDIALVEVVQLPAPTPARGHLDDDDPVRPAMSGDPLDDPDTFDGKSAPSYAALRE